MSNGLADQVTDLLEKYSKNVTEEMHNVFKKEAAKARSELKAASPRDSGQYVAGWAIKDESTRLTVDYTIYNRTPGLPHLLEFGHVIRNGTGRTFGSAPSHPHIASVNDELQNTVISELEKAVANA